MSESSRAARQASAASERAAERRGEIRIDVSFPILVFVESSSERVPAMVENVSLSGVLLRTETRLTPHSKVALEIQLGETKRVAIPGVIVRTAGGQLYGTAFAKLTDADADHLMNLAADYLKAAAPLQWFLE